MLPTSAGWRPTSPDPKLALHTRGRTMAKVLEKTLYEADYYAWTKEQAARLRDLAEARSNLPLDLLNLAEEVESLGRSDLATVRSQLRRIIEHLLKLEYSPASDPRLGWRESILEARLVIKDVITPTLRRKVETTLDATYDDARVKAETGLRGHGEDAAADVLPRTCPYTFEQITERDWYPRNRHERAGDRQAAGATE